MEKSEKERKKERAKYSLNQSDLLEDFKPIGTSVVMFKF